MVIAIAIVVVLAIYLFILYRLQHPRFGMDYEGLKGFALSKEYRGEAAWGLEVDPEAKSEDPTCKSEVVITDRKGHVSRYPDYLGGLKKWPKYGKFRYLPCEDYLVMYFGASKKCICFPKNY